MTGARDAPDRRPLDQRRLQRAKTLADLAWADLPSDHRLLLANIGAAQRTVVIGRWERTSMSCFSPLGIDA
jgi:hypothetical protein